MQLIKRLYVEIDILTISNALAFELFSKILSRERIVDVFANKSVCVQFKNYE